MTRTEAQREVRWMWRVAPIWLCLSTLSLLLDEHWLAALGSVIAFSYGVLGGIAAYALRKGYVEDE